MKCNQQDTCPVCGKDGVLEYEAAEICMPDGVNYPWKCKSCQAIGEEWYDISFSEHCNVTDKNGYEIKSLEKPIKREQSCNQRQREGEEVL